MRFLMLAEGDPETRDSWSGTCLSVLTQLRAAGHGVVGGDVDLYGASRWIGALRSFSPNRQRWRIKYHLGAPSFRLRSAVASKHVRNRQGEVDAVLQIGGTFLPANRGSTPLYLYCDSNIALAERGRQTGHSYAAPLSRDEVRAVHEQEASVYREADLIFAMSELLRRSFIDDFGIPEERVHTLHAGPNLNINVEQIQDKQTKDTSASPRTILFVGRDFERKGGDLLLAAFEIARKRFPEARLIVAGPVEEIIGAGVDWQGNLNPDDPAQLAKLIDLYDDADIFCLPTRYEPFGVAYLEAMLFGMPCVGSDVDAVPEIILDGETGFTVPTDDSEALAERLIQLMANPNQILEMGVAGRERALAHFTWPAIIGRMIAVIEAHEG